MEENFKVPIIGPKRPDESLEEKKPAKSEEFLCPYKVPNYSGPLPEKKFSFEVLKNGVIVEEIKNLNEKPYHVFGRLPVPNVDINSAHPTSSRFHCVLQYRPALPENDEKQIEEGWYIYDLDSTHGTFLNKNRIKPNIYVRMHVGHQLKLGNSTRCYILVGPSEDEEEQTELTITELKQQRIEKENERKQKELEAKLEEERIAKEKEEEGISWGMMDDAVEETDLKENPFAATNNEEIFINDPKKTLRGFFEREGHDLDYRCDELQPGVFICRVELPIDDEFGNPTICEVQHKGKKKDCVVQCALECCRILDRHGVLRQANHEPRRKRKVSDSDSDNDNFFDRTGDVEKKRLKKQGQQEQEALTFEQLTENEKEILIKIQDHEKKLNELIEIEKQQKHLNQLDDDDLDSFMSHLSDKKIDKFEIKNMKNELQNLRIEHSKIQKLINIARPSVILPPVNQSKGKLPLFGKRNRLPKDFGVKKTSEIAKLNDNDSKEFEIEEEDDDDDVDKTFVKITEEPTSSKVEHMTNQIHEKPRELPIKPETISIDKPPTDINKADQEIPTNNDETNVKKADDEASIEPPQESPPKKNKISKKLYKSSNRYRANIDINDDNEYIDQSKVSTWLPPENQSGDGSCHLNDKFGY